MWNIVNTKVGYRSIVTQNGIKCVLYFRRLVHSQKYWVILIIKYYSLLLRLDVWNILSILNFISFCETTERYPTLLCYLRVELCTLKLITSARIAFCLLFYPHVKMNCIKFRIIVSVIGLFDKLFLWTQFRKQLRLWLDKCIFMNFLMGNLTPK